MLLDLASLCAPLTCATGWLRLLGLRGPRCWCKKNGKENRNDQMEFWPAAESRVVAVQAQRPALLRVFAMVGRPVLVMRRP